MPRVSVIMNCYNCVRYLREALDSVYSQTYKDFEVIFWNNLSTDGSVEIARQYPVRFFSNTSLLPLGESRNLAIAQAQGEYIAFLDCDDVWLPTKLEKQVALLNSRPELALVYANCYHINAKGIVQRTSFTNTSRPQRGHIFNALFASNFIPMVTAIARRSRLPAFAYGFDIAEEYDVWLKMAAYLEFDYIDEPLAKYRIYPENTSSIRREQKAHEEQLIIDYWLVKRPWLKHLAKRKHIMLSAEMAWYYYKGRQIRKLFAECFNLIRMLPDSLMLVKKIPYVMR